MLPYPMFSSRFSESPLRSTTFCPISILFSPNSVNSVLSVLKSTFHNTPPSPLGYKPLPYPFFSILFKACPRLFPHGGASHQALATIPFRIIFFAHPHRLTPIESYSYKKQGRGWGRREFWLSNASTQTLPLFFTAGNHPTRTNARNSIPVIRLLHGSRDTVGGGPVFSPLATCFSLLTTHYHLLTFSPMETNSAQRAAYPQSLPTRDIARARARAPSLWSVSEC